MCWHTGNTMLRYCPLYLYVFGYRWLYYGQISYIRSIFLKTCTFASARPSPPFGPTLLLYGANVAVTINQTDGCSHDDGRCVGACQGSRAETSACAQSERLSVGAGDLLGHKGRDPMGESLGLTTGGGTGALPKESPSTAGQGASWANCGCAKARSEMEASATRQCDYGIGLEPAASGA